MAFTLESLGLDEIDCGVCEDTRENRAALKSQGVSFKSIENGFLEVDLRSKQFSEKTVSMLERNKLFLKDPRNPWSDYLPLNEIPLDAMEVAPPWMQRALNRYNDAVQAGKPEEKLPVVPGRCKRIRADGSRCFAWSWNSAQSDGYCRYHAPVGAFDYAAHMHRLSEKARVRIAGMQEDALDALQELVLEDSRTPPQVRLRAAETILDRAGLSSKNQIEFSGTVKHEGPDPADAIRDRLRVLAERTQTVSPSPAELESSSIVDAEIVEVEEVPGFLKESKENQ